MKQNKNFKKCHITSAMWWLGCPHVVVVAKIILGTTGTIDIINIDSNQTLRHVNLLYIKMINI